MELTCAHCGQAFRDTTGQLTAVLAQATAGRLALVLGCGRCGQLFFPAVDAPARALTPSATVVAAQPEGADRYEAGPVLGEGGMGIVRLARDRQGGRTVCVKQLRAHVDASSLRQELAALSRLDHPHIIRLLDQYEHQGCMHMVLEYVDGEPLDRYLEERGALSEMAALALMAPVLEAIAAAHQVAIVHRDLKPANVLIEWVDGVARPRLLDYGIALVDGLDARTAVTGAGITAGTPFYMSPEQLNGEQVPPQADVYAAGVMLAEVLLGATPFKATTFHALIMEKLGLSDGLTLPDGVASKECAALVRSLTRPDPRARPSAAEAAQRVRALLGPAHAAISPAAWNLSFWHMSGDGSPLGWHHGAGLVSGVSLAYRAKAPEAQQGLPAFPIELTAPADADDQFGTLMQSVSIRGMEGAEVHFHAWLMVRNVPGGASLWMRADDARGATLAFDNMSDRALQGALQQRDMKLSLRLPPGTAWLHYGILLVGPGSVSATDLTLTARRVDGQSILLHLDRVYPMTRT